MAATLVYQVPGDDWGISLVGAWKRTLECREFGRGYEHQRTSNSVVVVEHAEGVAAEPGTYVSESCGAAVCWLGGWVGMPGLCGMYVGMDDVEAGAGGPRPVCMSVCLSLAFDWRSSASCDLRDPQPTIASDPIQHTPH